MWCTKCQQQLAGCTCPDIKERLESLSSAPNFAYKKCSKCDNHYARCKCAEPTWIIVGGTTK